MLEIRVPRERFSRKMVVLFVYLFVVSFFVSLVDTLVSAYAPSYSHLSSTVMGMVSLLIVAYLAYFFISSLSSIYLADNMLYISHGLIKKSVINLDYTQKIVFSRGLKRMLIVDAEGKKIRIRVSDAGAENIQSLIRELSEVADRYGFLLVDENSGTSWGHVKGHPLAPEKPEAYALSSSRNDPPYRVK